jgi:hypothetical protein
VLKEALKEWLDEEFATLGKWTLSGIAALVLAILLWVMINIIGWKPI